VKSGHIARQKHTGVVKGEVHVRRAFSFVEELKEAAMRQGARTVEVVRTDKFLSPEIYTNSAFSFCPVITP
jgi:hypothetical protein